MSDINLGSDFIHGFPQEYIYLFLIGFLLALYIRLTFV